MSQFLDAARNALRESEKVILKHFDTGVAVQTKADQSPVTIADQEAERIIRSVIHDAFPEHGFLGEETGASDTDSEYVWIVDPIDGTRNYSRGIPLYGTLIALMQKGELMLGAMNMPSLREEVYAEKGRGAYLNGKSIHVSSVTNFNSAYLSTGGLKKNYGTPLDTIVGSLVGDAWSDKAFGDCWNFSLVAQGKLDVVVDTKIRIWDVASAKVIIEEAGGKLTDLAGKEITPEVTSVIATNGLLHNTVVSYFES